MKALYAEISTEKSAMIEKVLVAVDLSAHSETTAIYAAGIAKCFNASLTLVHVNESVPLYGYASEYTYALIEDEHENLQKLLDQLTRKVRTLGAVCDSIILFGSPAEEISVLARDMDADLIVTASHHPRLLARLLNLDQAPHIVHRAPCPVLVYHEQNTQQAFTTLRLAVPEPTSAWTALRDDGKLRAKGSSGLETAPSRSDVPEWVRHDPFS